MPLDIACREAHKRGGGAICGGRCKYCAAGKATKKCLLRLVRWLLKASRQQNCASWSDVKHWGYMCLLVSLHMVCYLFQCKNLFNLGKTIIVSRVYEISYHEQKENWGKIRHNKKVRDHHTRIYTVWSTKSRLTKYSVSLLATIVV